MTVSTLFFTWPVYAKTQTTSSNKTNIKGNMSPENNLLFKPFYVKHMF